jgi:hypothetical protein
VSGSGDGDRDLDAAGMGAGDNSEPAGSGAAAGVPVRIPALERPVWLPPLFADALGKDAAAFVAQRVAAARIRLARAPLGSLALANLAQGQDPARATLSFELIRQFSQLETQRRQLALEWDCLQMAKSGIVGKVPGDEELASTEEALRDTQERLQEIEADPRFPRSWVRSEDGERWAVAYAAAEELRADARVVHDQQPESASELTWCAQPREASGQLDATDSRPVSPEEENARRELQEQYELNWEYSLDGVVRDGRRYLEDRTGLDREEFSARRARHRQLDEAGLPAAALPRGVEEMFLARDTERLSAWVDDARLRFTRERTDTETLAGLADGYEDALRQLRPDLAIEDSRACERVEDPSLLSPDDPRAELDYDGVGLPFDCGDEDLPPEISPEEWLNVKQADGRSMGEKWAQAFAANEALFTGAATPTARKATPEGLERADTDPGAEPAAPETDQGLDFD